MKRCFLFLTMMALLLCATAARADYFSAALPDSSYVYDACALDGGHLAVMATSGVYRADLATGEIVLLAPAPNNSAGELIVSADGSLYTLAHDWDHGLERLYRLDEAASGWTEEAVIAFDALDVYEDDYPNIQKAVFLGDQLFFTVYRDGKTALLASYDLRTGAVEGYGDFGARPWSSPSLYATGEGILAFDTDEDQELFQLYYDAAQRKITKTPAAANVESGHLQEIVYDAEGGLYWAVVWQESGTALYSGAALDQLTVAAQPISGRQAVPVGDDCVIIASDWLMSYQIVKNAAGQIVLSNFDSPYDTGFTVQTGITVSTVYSDVADILNMRSSDVDIFAFWTERDPGLRIIKDKGYFVDLSGSDVLSAQAARLYPNLIDALTTEDGKLAAWIGAVEVYLPDADERMLAEYGLEAPKTLPELMDQLNVLIDEGAFSGGEYVPFGFVQYGQKSFIEYVLKRYIFEQEVQGRRLNFDNEELRALLSRIITELPRESQYGMETGEESAVYELYVVPAAVDKDDLMPLKLGDGSPLAIETSVMAIVVNPYSKHQEEAIRYLEYIAQKPGYNDYILYADITEPIENEWVVRRLAEVEAEIAALEAKEGDADALDTLDELRAELSSLEPNRYRLDAEDLAAWHITERALVIQQETVYTDELSQLVDRLVAGSMTMDAFIGECNRYVNMVYAENGR